MNRSSLAKACAAALMVCAGGALAQSAVTVFGVVDLAVRWVDNDDSQYQLASGGLQASRLGIRAAEDLGGGLTAGIWLEGELLPDNGNASGFSWARRSTASLVSSSLGELRLGRDRVPTYLDWADYDPFGDSGIGASTRLSVATGIVPVGGAYSTFKRADNLGSYILPGTLGGFFGQLAAAAGEGNLGSRYTGGRLGYRAGPAAISGSYGVTEVTAADDAELLNIGASYDFRTFKIMALYSSLEIGAASQDNWLLGAILPLGSAELRASYQMMDGGGTLNGQEAWMAAVGGTYPLSRRTALYATYSTIDNTGTRFTVASGPPLTAGHSSSGFDLGIRHSF
jgi:predicted porin